MDHLLPLLVRYGYGITLVGAFLEAETIAALAGVLVRQAVPAHPWAVLVSAAGAVAGDQARFYAGRGAGPSLWTHLPRLARHVAPIGPWIDQKGGWIAAASRSAYGTRIASPLVPGARGYATPRFLAINGATGAAWAAPGATAGYLLDTETEQLLGEMARLAWLALAAVIAVLGWRWLRRATIPWHPRRKPLPPQPRCSRHKRMFNRSYSRGRRLSTAGSPG